MKSRSIRTRKSVVFIHKKVLTIIRENKIFVNVVVILDDIGINYCE